MESIEIAIEKGDMARLTLGIDEEVDRAIP